MWDAMVERAFTKFEYSGNIDQFLLSMGRLGYDDKALARLREIDEMHPEEFEND
jgi:hypothetical protein